MRKKHLGLGVAILVAGPSCAFAQFAPPPRAVMTPDRLFAQQCASCHSTVAGETRVGPSLSGVVRRKAGRARGYSAYSDALRQRGAAGLVWTAKNLDMWLADTSAFAPGSMMNYRQADPAKRAAIVAYLSQLK